MRHDLLKYALLINCHKLRLEVVYKRRSHKIAPLFALTHPLSSLIRADTP